MKNKFLIFLLTLPALLPLPILYIVSDIAAYVLYHCVRYRRKVVDGNLARCFPDKTEKERKRMARQFYRNFTDSIMETIKLLHISETEIKQRVTFDNVELLDQLMSEGRSIVVYFAHTFNWELAPSISLHTRLNADEVAFCQIYRPLKSAVADSLMLHIRSRFGSTSVPKSTALRHLLTLRREGRISITGFMSDQHTGHGDPGHLTTLLGQPTLMISGTETLARKLNMAVVYWDTERLKRGHYRITTQLITEQPSTMPEGEITEKYTRLLEATIRRDPPIWLWSHNRWKNEINTKKL